MELTGPPSTTRSIAPPSGWLWPHLALRVVYPPTLKDHTIALQDGLVLGRAPAQDVEVLADRTVSARHVKVSVDQNGTWLTDLGSTNGTRINGEPLRRPACIVPHCVVRCGDVLGVVDDLNERRFGESNVLPGSHLSVARIRQMLPNAAADSAPVLITGETGTGKERLAAEVHRLSGRRGAYVTVNCAELSPQLIESQLFGHERGAFTGAAAAHDGLFAAAHDGTLFLDEIGELPIDLQPKLLRALQENEVRPVGSLRPRSVNVRVVAATNRVLPQQIQQGTFRRDLYARLALWEFSLPPLRWCRQDLLSWIQLLLRAWNVERRTTYRLDFLPDAAERILTHAWLDNLRGLNRLVHRLASTHPEGPVGLRTLSECLPELFVPESGTAHVMLQQALQPTSSAEPDRYRYIGGANRGPGLGPANEAPRRRPLSPSERPSREDFLAALAANGYSVRATSKYYDKDRRQIYRWMTLYGVDKTSAQQESE